MDSVIRGTRTAHPTNDLEAVRKFYDALGLTVLATFADHDGYSGVVYGLPGASHELEFTLAPRLQQALSWSEETLLVFYLDTEDAFNASVEALERLRAPRVASQNPYWDRGGVTFLDPDGRRVVIFRAHG